MDIIYCSSCGKLCKPGEKYCPSCGKPLATTFSKKTNRYDESVRDWFASKTFKTLLTIGLIGGCCFATCSFLFYGSLVKLFDSLLALPPEYQSSISTQQSPTEPLPTQRPPTQQAQIQQLPTPTQQALTELTQQVLQQPHIAGETMESHPIDEKTKSMINNWLLTYRPVHTPYWFVTSWHREEDGRTFVSLAAIRLSSPDETWHLDGEPNGENKVLWIGSVIVTSNRVELYQP